MKLPYNDSHGTTEKVCFIAVIIRVINLSLLMVFRVLFECAMQGTLGSFMCVDSKAACERSPAKWRNLRGKECSNRTPESKRTAHCCSSTLVQHKSHLVLHKNYTCRTPHKAVNHKNNYNI